MGRPGREDADNYVVPDIGCGLPAYLAFTETLLCLHRKITLRRYGSKAAQRASKRMTQGDRSILDHAGWCGCLADVLSSTPGLDERCIHRLSVGCSSDRLAAFRCTKWLHSLPSVRRPIRIQ